jgi:iron complex transport system ATP-binding protein
MNTSAPAVLEADNVQFSYGSHRALDTVSLSLEKGRFYGLLGPNGSGKSTLLRILTGGLKPVSGKITVMGKALDQLKKKELGHILAFVPQEFGVDFPFTCYEVVMMGRYVYQGILGLGGSTDDEVVRRCLEFTRTGTLSQRPVTQLSGGELQRVMLAQALAQEGEILLLDEPTSHLDIKFQIEILELLKRLNEEQGLTIISSFHDLNLASLYCHYLYFLKGGSIVESGPVEQVFTEEIINSVFEVNIQVLSQPGLRRPLMVFNGSASTHQEIPD